MATRKKVDVAAGAPVASYAKEKLVASKKYGEFRDYLSGNLKDGQLYTFDEVDELINKMKGKGE